MLTVEKGVEGTIAKIDTGLTSSRKRNRAVT